MSHTVELPSDTPASIDAVNLLDSPDAKVARRLFTTDWKRHPLGPVERWPKSLRTMVHAMLASRFQMWLGWGPELYFFYNDAYAPTLGLKEERAFGTPFRALWPEIWEDLKPRISAVMEDGKATWDEALLLFLERNGYAEETYHTFSYSPIREDKGNIGGLFCTVTEVTDRVIAERRMLLLRELSAGLAFAKQESDVFTVVEKCLAKASQDLPFALFYLFDATAEHAILTRTFATLPGTDLAPREIALSGGGVWPAAEMLHSNRSVVVTDLASRHADIPRGVWEIPARDAVVVPIAQQGQALAAGFMVVGINPYRPFDSAYQGFLELFAGQIAAGVSSARAYEAERKRAEALAEIDRAKTTFFTNVSHELRTPLTLMLGPIEEIANQPANNGHAVARELANVAHRNGLRLLKLVNTLLDFSRMEAGRMQASFAPTELGSFTAELASTFRSAVEKAGLRFVVDCPPVSEPVYVDRDLWEKIVLNLLSNAYKFTLRGEICIRLREEPDAIRLDVSDTGTGIPEAAQARLFERFYRVEGTQGRTQEGTGVGLALVHELVKLHGGTVGARSEVGEGSTFTVTLRRGHTHLPAERVANRAPESSATAARAFIQEASRWNAADDLQPGIERRVESPIAGETVSAVKPRVLLVDDNADMRDYVRRLLSNKFTVVTARDGQEAVEELERGRPDLILSDVMMPRLDGFGLVKAVRAHPNWRSLPVILLSARAGEEATVEGIGRGADDYLVKPFSARELIARVSTHLELSRVRKEAELKIREAEERVRLAVEAAEVGTWDWNIREDRLAWSERSIAVFGSAPKEGVGGAAAFLERVHPDDRDRAAEEVRLTLETGAPYRSEVRIVRPDGKVRWISTQGKLFRDQAGSPVRLLGAFTDITERREREQKLRDTRARLDATLDAAAVGTWTWDMATNRLLGDASLFKLFSYPHPEEEIAPLDALLPQIHADDLPRVQQSLQRALRGESDKFEEDYRVNLPDGSQRWIASRGRYRQDLDGTPVMSGVLLDITERKNAEQERAQLLAQEREAREEAQALSESARALSTDLDLHSTVQKATDAATKLSGAQFGAFFYNLVNERQESYVLYTLSGAPREAFEKFGLPRNTAVFGPTFRGEGVVRLDDVTKDPRYGKNAPHHGMPKGHLPVCSYLAVPVISRSGEVLGGMFFGHSKPGMFTARSERIAVGIAAQAAIAIDNAKLYQRVQNTVDRLNFSLSSLRLGDWQWDAETDVMICSPRTAEIYGLSPEEKHSREALRNRLHPDDRDRAREEAKRSFETATDYDVEYRVMNPVLGTRWVAVKGRPVYDHNKKLTGMMGVVQDITDRKQAEDELRQSRQQLEQHAELLEQTVVERTAKLRETIGELEAFSYSISHDMRAPLRSMYGYSELLVKEYGPKLDDAGMQYLKRISTNAARLELLVRDVLAYSKVAKEDITLVPVSLEVFVPGLIGQMPELQRPNITVTVRHPLPVVLGHEAYLSQIFTNLVGNSIKFARAGIPAVVEIDAAVEDGTARITVRDNGIGIDPDHFARIFEIFGRVYPDKKYEGTGIGLAIVKKAVQRMGGTIGVESTLGNGATFWFTLQIP